MVFGMIVVYVVLKVILLAIAIGVGFLLHWILPGVDLGMCILLSLMASGISLYFFTNVLGSLTEGFPYRYDEDDDYDDDEMYEEEINPRLRLKTRVRSTTSKRKKRRKS